MIRSLFDKSVLFLVAIVVLIAGFAMVISFSLRVEPIQKAVDDDRPFNVALILEHNGKPLATQILMYYPGNARGALLDIPSDTGLIIRSVNRMDRIDLAYRKDDPEPFLRELSSLTGASLDYYLIMTLEGYQDLVDVLDGLTVFIPNRIDTVIDEKRSVLPVGSVTLDGSKMGIYALYQESDRLETETVARRQVLFQALIKRMGERQEYVLHPKTFPLFAERMRTNLKEDSLKRLTIELCRMDTERIVLQRVTGTYRPVEGKNLLFPAWDGQLVKDIVKQTLNALLNAEATAVEDKVFTIEILNGTPTRGLAQKTAEIFSSFGYEIVSVGNATSQDVDKTRVLYRYDSADAAVNLAKVIRCENVSPDAMEGGSSAPADFVIILGKDFNGRYCVD